MTRTLWLATLAFVAALTVLIVSYQIQPATAFSTKVSINVDKNQREFLLIESPPPNSGSALLIAFHGAGDSPEKLLRDSRLDQLTTETALVLACPFPTVSAGTPQCTVTPRILISFLSMP